MHALTPLARTPLYALQKERGGRFVPFAGWELPVQFAGVMAEHRAVRTAAGLFDVSHMGEAVVHGKESLAALQYVLTQDLRTLRDGRAVYTVMCSADGGMVDDLIVYREHAERYFLCVNAARQHDDLAHLRQHCAAFDCTVDDVSSHWAQLALQGRAAAPILAALQVAAAADLRPFAWCDTQIEGCAVRLARTGYTGEPGFELYCPAAQADTLCRALLRVGEPLGLVLCGLGARDTLRLEMKYPLYGHDIDLQHDPIEAGLGWVVKMDKGDFLGRTALQRRFAEGPQRQWVGFEVLGRGIARPGYPLMHAGELLGTVSSGTFSPSLQKAIGCAYVPQAHAAVGTKFAVVIRQAESMAQVVPTPFYKPR